MKTLKKLFKIFGFIPKNYVFRYKLHDPKLTIDKRTEGIIEITSRSVSNARNQVLEHILLKHPQYKQDLNIELISSN